MLKLDKKTLKLSSVGFIAGVANGFLGAAGGIIITYFLGHLLKGEEGDKNRIFSAALLTMLPISAISLAIYLSRDYLPSDPKLLWLTIPAALGGACGAILLKKVRFGLIRLLFTAVVIYSGISMLI